MLIRLAARSRPGARRAGQTMARLRVVNAESETLCSVVALTLTGPQLVWGVQALNGSLGEFVRTRSRCGDWVAVGRERCLGRVPRRLAVGSALPLRRLAAWRWVVFDGGRVSVDCAGFGRRDLGAGGRGDPAARRVGRRGYEFGVMRVAGRLQRLRATTATARSTYRGCL